MIVAIPSGMSNWLKVELQGDGGHDARQRDGQDDDERDRLAAEEREAGDREGAQAAQDQGDRRGAKASDERRGEGIAQATTLECRGHPLEGEAGAARSPHGSR